MAFFTSLAARLSYPAAGENGGEIMTIQNMELKLSAGWQTLERGEGCWQYADIQVFAADGGAVTLRGATTPVLALRLTLDPVAAEDSLVLGDAWERGYGDLGWAAPDADRRLPWYFFAWQGQTLFCRGVMTRPNALCFWNFDGRTPVLTMDLRCGTEPLTLGGRTLEVCRVVAEEKTGDLHQACADFCARLCPDPRMPAGPIFGGNDWYCNYGCNSAEKIRTHARRIARCAEGTGIAPYMVIDDGWQLCHSQLPGQDYNGGPWRFANDNFGDMKALAADIRALGVIPGIWIRPLQTREKLPEDCRLTCGRGDYPLDPSVPQVLEYLRREIRTIVEWGYRLIKFDFSCADVFGKWGFQMEDDLYLPPVLFHDRTRTTAQILKDFYAALREAAGEDVLLMGCNTVGHLAAGIVDIQRTGDDTSGRDWGRTKKYGVNTLAFRMMQHGTFFRVDADCVGITREIGWEKNRQWLDVLAKSGTPLFVSIGEDAFTPQVEDGIRQAFRHAAAARQVSRPLDWQQTLTPEVWESDFGTHRYSW